ncbi:acyltransferase LovD [Podospora fimiseda]|uniref:Acyltransferase LovD n=1 Tax=Podospora fimiseda TaxID=252190 RepID=A0AAN7BRP9_9PEZI|nr:acyltransferase LovD [Podospora fimiseda]
MPTQAFESRIQKAIDEGIIPGAVILATSKDGILSPVPSSSISFTNVDVVKGKLNYSTALGYSHLPPATPQPIPMTLDTVFTLASMTKLLTGIAILQLVERGKITLETDVAEILPELSSQPILTGFDTETGEPILTKRKNSILLRHLLSHSSGTSYVFLDENLKKYFEKTGKQLPMPLSPVGGKTVVGRFGYPLLFEPGEGWAYGSGMDWVGEIVRRVGGKGGLDEWVREEILSKVGVERDRITFYPSSHVKVAGMGNRNEETGKVEGYPGWGEGKSVEVFPGWGGGEEGGNTEEKMDEMGGEGAYADLRGYMKVMESLLRDDGKLLKSETVEMLFEGLLKEDKAKEGLKESVRNPGWIVGWVPDNGGKYDWGVGGLVTTEDAEEGGKGRRKGFLQWGGVFNLAWVSIYTVDGWGRDG